MKKIRGILLTSVAAAAAVMALASMDMQTVAKETFCVYATFHCELFDSEGNLKDQWESRNLVTTAGKNDLLDKYFKGSAYTAAWYVGVKNSGTIAAADTAGSHGGWTENTGYSQGTRPTLTLGTPASGSVDNSASRAQFTFTGSNTIAGAFLITNSTKGGTSGTLYSATDFAASRAVENNDNLYVTVTLSFT